MFADISNPPLASKKQQKIKQLGFTRTDPYAWMRDENWQMVLQNPAKLNANISTYLHEENVYSAQVMAHTKNLQAHIYQSLRARIQDEQISPPVNDGVYCYAHRYRAGDQYGVYIRQAAYDISQPLLSSFEKEAQIVLDAEHLACLLEKSDASVQDKEAFFSLGAVCHSDNHRFVAYSVDAKGAEYHTIYVRDIETQEPVIELANNAGESVVWANNTVVFWVERNEQCRPCRVWCQDIYNPQSRVLVYEETNPAYFIDVVRSDSRRFIYIHVHDHTSSAVWYVSCATPFAPAKCINTLTQGHEYSVEDSGDSFYILTNLDAPDFKISTVKIDQIQDGQDSQHLWQDYIAHTPGVLLLEVQLYAHYLVRLERHNASPRFVVLDLRTQDSHMIEFAEPLYDLVLGTNYQFDTDWMRFSFASPRQPRQVFDYHMGEATRILRHEDVLPLPHNADDYVTHRLYVPARDGEEIPVSLIWHKDTPPDLNAPPPCWLYGYGAYGITIPTGFRSSVLEITNRGFVYAIAHIRGGMAKGYHWYQQGKLADKCNSFNDFVDVGNALIAQGYSAPNALIAHGGSAGGLLMGAVLNQAPNLFAGMIAAVPFVDVLNTMSDPSLPLTPPEWQEWGNPLVDAQAYKTIQSYCPYENVKDNRFSAVLATTSISDPRVGYWEAAKWIARLRECQKESAPLLLKVNMQAGHQGASGRYGALEETAFTYAFALAALAYKQDISPGRLTL